MPQKPPTDDPIAAVQEALCRFINTLVGCQKLGRPGSSNSNGARTDELLQTAVAAEEARQHVMESFQALVRGLAGKPGVTVADLRATEKAIVAWLCEGQEFLPVYGTIQRDDGTGRYVDEQHFSVDKLAKGSRVPALYAAVFGRRPRRRATALALAAHGMRVAPLVHELEQLRPFLKLKAEQRRSPDATTVPIGESGDWNKLTDRQRDCLHALLKLKAFDAGSRQRTTDIAGCAEGRAAKVDNFKEPLSELVLHGWVQSKRGREGGYWLTDEGRNLLASSGASAGNACA